MYFLCFYSVCVSLHPSVFVSAAYLQICILMCTLPYGEGWGPGMRQRGKKDEMLRKNK